MRVVIIGAGVVGVTTAYELHRDGHEVIVVDQASAAGEETSWGNAGLLAPGHSYTWASPAAPRILAKSLVSRDQALRFTPRPELELYRWSALFLRNCTAQRARTNTLRKLGLCSYSLGRLHEITQETAIEYDGIKRGLVYAYGDNASFEAGIGKMRLMQDAGQRIEVLTPQQVAELEPALAGAQDAMVGALYCPDDESGDCSKFTKALAAWLADRGVEFRYETRVLGFQAWWQRVEAVQTSRGPIRADHYVLCAGPQSAALGRQLGLRLPIYPIKGYSVTLPVAATHTPPQIGGVDEDTLVAWARFGDRFRLTSTAEFAGYDTSHSEADFATMLRTANRLFPNAADWSAPTYWAGLRPMTPEGTPIIGPARHTNTWLNTGHGHMGWTMSCGSARVFADMFAGRPTAIDVTGMTLTA
jgi:D-amino-acid dehydrogenase